MSPASLAPLASVSTSVSVSVTLLFFSNEPTAISSKNNNNRDLFYVIALIPHRLPGKVNPRQCHYQQNRDTVAAQMRRYKCLNNADADADAKEYNTSNFIQMCYLDTSPSLYHYLEFGRLI